MQMNSTSVSSNSITINGEAVVLEAGSEEERWCKEQHVANNTFEQDGAGLNPLSVQSSRGEGDAGDSGKGAYIEGEDVRVVVVRIKDGRISDWKGNVSDWAIASPGASTERVAVNGT